MNFKIFFINFIFFCLILSIINAKEEDGKKPIIKEHEILKLSEELKKSLNPNAFQYYTLNIEKNITSNESSQPYILIKLKRDRDLDILENILSDPNIYISDKEIYPNKYNHEWASEQFGDEIVTINTKNIKNDTLYISVFCATKCNYKLYAKIYNELEIKKNEEFIHTFSLSPGESNKIKIEFEFKKNKNSLDVNCISINLKPYRIFMAEDSVSSTNTLKSKPIFINGYKFHLTENVENGDITKKYEILVENISKEKLYLILWSSYEKSETLIKENQIIMEQISPDTKKCFKFILEDNYIKDKKELIISAMLFNGNGELIINDLDINPIYSSLLLTLDSDGYYNNKDLFSKELKVCYQAYEETTLKLKIYYLDNIDSIKIFNGILPGIDIEDIVPYNKFTQYYINQFDIEIDKNKDFYVELEVIQGNPKLYLLFDNYVDYKNVDKNIIDKKQLEEIKLQRKKKLIEGTKINSYTYKISIKKEDNKCLNSNFDNNLDIIENLSKIGCEILIIVECQKNEDNKETNCMYNLKYDQVGKLVMMRPRKIYDNIIVQNEIDKYRINIIGDDIKNIAIVLVQNTGMAELKVVKINDLEINKIKSDYNYNNNVIEVKAEDYKMDYLQGDIYLEVKGLSFASYSIYFYPFNNNEQNDEFKHKKISMNLINGNYIQDFFNKDINIKIYAYEFNIKNFEGNDFIFMTLDKKEQLDCKMYIFNDLNKFNIKGGKEVSGFLFESDYNDNIILTPNNTKSITLNNLNTNQILYIVIKKNFNNHPPFRGENEYFNLGITNSYTPLKIKEGIEYKFIFNKEHKSQKFSYEHPNIENDFKFSLYVILGKVLINIKINNNDFIENKIIVENYYLKINNNEIKKYCLINKLCNIEISIFKTNDTIYNEFGSEIFLACQSGKDTPIKIELNKIHKRSIFSQEKNYLYLELNKENLDKKLGINLNLFFLYGTGKMYIKKILKEDYNKLICTNFNNSENIFPNKDNFNYESKEFYTINNKYLTEVNIPYNDLNEINENILLITIEGISPLQNEGKIEYLLSMSNQINELMINKNYKLYTNAGELSYFHFRINNENIKKIFISMTNKNFDADFYINIDTNDDFNKNTNDMSLLPSLSKYQWKSKGSLNEYLEITKDDSYFIERKSKNINGDYYIAVHSYGSSYYNFFISTSDIKLIPMNEGNPAPCLCDSKTENNKCYFLYENFNINFDNNINMEKRREKEVVFFSEFTFGSANFYGKLYSNGNPNEIFNELPNNYDYHFQSDYKQNYIKVNPMKIQENIKFNKKLLTPESVIVILGQCMEKSLFDFNVIPLRTHKEIIEYHQNMLYLNINKNNIFYLQKFDSLENNKIKFMYYSYKNYTLNLEARAYIGSAIINSYSEKFGENSTQKFIMSFGVDDRDKEIYINKINKENCDNKYIFFEVEALEDCLFYINLKYENIIKEIPINIKTNEILNSNDNENNTFYFDMNPEIDSVQVNIKSKSKISVYIKINIINKKSNNEIFYDLPSNVNYDFKGTTNTYTNYINFKIDNIEQSILLKNNKNLVRVLLNVKIKENNNNYRDNFDILITPIIEYDNIKNPEKFISNKVPILENDYFYYKINKDAKMKNNFILTPHIDDTTINKILLIELSGCDGDFEYELYSYDKSNGSNIIINKIKTNLISKGNGKKVIKVNKNGKLDNIINNNEYILRVWGIGEDVINIDNNENNYKDISILIFYHYINKEDLMKYNNLKETFRYDIISKNRVMLTLPEINNIEDYMYDVVLTNKKEEYKYMESTCFLTQQFNNKPINRTIFVNKQLTNREIEIKGLDINNYEKVYYVNIIIKNKKTGEIFTFKPIQIISNSYDSNVTLIIILFFVVCLAAFCAFYFHRKIKLTQNNINFQIHEELNSIGINDKKLPKTIKELNEIKLDDEDENKINDDGNKDILNNNINNNKKREKSMSKYSSLTEDGANNII